MKLSVGLPTFKANEIVWLPMESLCNQEGINFTWELIICEELCHENEGGYCGKDFFMSYRDRLHKVGCKEIKFIDLEGYVALENKWRFIVAAADGRSEMLLLQASDNYSPCERLKSAYELTGMGADWIHSLKMYFYNCKTNQVIFRNVSHFSQPHGVNIGIRLDLIKDLPFRDEGRFVDTWLRRTVKKYKPEIIEMPDDGRWETGINTDGFNRISLKRVRHYGNPQSPFYETDKNIRDIVPGYIADRLLELK